jgi:hypothetical protein
MNEALRFVAILSAAVITAHAAPTVRCVSPQFDFGTQTPGATVVHRFPVTNAGDAPLTLTVAHACCGASMQIARSPVPPGETTEVMILLTLTHQPGSVLRALYVKTNDPAVPFLRLALNGKVANRDAASAPMAHEEPAVMAYPSEIVLTDSASTTGVDRVVDLHPINGRAFSVRAVKFNGVTGRVSLNRAPDGVWRLSLKALLPVTASRAVPGVVVETDLPDHPQVVIPIRIISENALLVHTDQPPGVSP